MTGMSKILKSISPLSRQLPLILIDGLLLAIVFTAAFYLRFDFSIPESAMDSLTTLIVPVIAIKLIILNLFGLHRRMWRYVGMQDMYNIILAILVSTLAISVVIYAIYDIFFPRSVIALDSVLALAFISGARFISRAVMGVRHGGILPSRVKPILIFGASSSGESIIREMFRRGELPYRPVGLIDDDPRKQGSSIHGVKVLGTREQLKELVHKYQIDEVFICMPAASRQVIRDIFFQCQELGVLCKTLPGIHEIINGSVSVDQIKKVDIEDILGREPARVDLKIVSDYITDNVVAITGAGGSIGSELCRQISRLKPALLLILDQNETGLFLIEKELVDQQPSVPTVPVVLDVANYERTKALLAEYKVSVIFHAAAHKHVPLMEANLVEAIDNNLIATRVIAKAAIESQVERFVSISTDKAVEPVSIMGITKALAEKIIQMYSAENSTRFVNVRFGNVLDSSGSVVPIFRQQIARGGPITVTHPDMARYFMTITEAVQLVILAGSIGRGGETFVLDMGEPISILELAQNMIRLSGFEIDKDVSIEFTGVRPGEKIVEKLFWNYEASVPTEYSKLMVAKSSFVPPKEFDESINRLERILIDGNAAELKEELIQICNRYLYEIPGYNRDTA